MMFALAIVVTIIICAIPLSLALAFGMYFVGINLFVASAAGVLSFVIGCAMVIKGLVLKNN